MHARFEVISAGKDWAPVGIDAGNGSQRSGFAAGSVAGEKLNYPASLAVVQPLRRQLLLCVQGAQHLPSLQLIAYLDRDLDHHAFLRRRYVQRHLASLKNNHLVVKVQDFSHSHMDLSDEHVALGAISATIPALRKRGHFDFDFAYSGNSPSPSCLDHYVGRPAKDSSQRRSHRSVNSLDRPLIQ